MVYGTYNELVIGAFVNQLITFGGPTLWKPQHFSIQRAGARGLKVRGVSHLAHSLERWWISGAFYIDNTILYNNIHKYYKYHIS